MSTRQMFREAQKILGDEAGRPAGGRDSSTSRNPSQLSPPKAAMQEPTPQSAQRTEPGEVRTRRTFLTETCYLLLELYVAPPRLTP